MLKHQRVSNLYENDCRFLVIWHNLFEYFLRQETIFPQLVKRLLKAFGKPSSKTFPVGTRSKTSFLTSTNICIYIYKHTKTSNNKHDWTPMKHLNIAIEQKSSCNPFFFTYCENITNFLFWIIWTCLAVSIKINNANF